jgi:NAD-dependent SIR2 family protein deacetylase
MDNIKITNLDIQSKVIQLHSEIKNLKSKKCHKYFIHEPHKDGLSTKVIIKSEN